MRRLPNLLLALAAFAVIGYAAYAVSSGPESDELGAEGEDAREPDRVASADRRGKNPIFRPMFKSRMQVEPQYEAREHEQVIEPTVPTVGEISSEDALAAFNASLEAMDEAMERGRTSKKEKRELYSRATNAFTALSTHLDARDPEQRIVLEEAHFEMKQRMKALKMTVPKRTGTVLESSGL